VKEHRQRAEAGYDIEHEVWDLAVAEHVREALVDLPEDERKPSSSRTSRATPTGRSPSSSTSPRAP
jgi:hypothetical protein